MIGAIGDRWKALLAERGLGGQSVEDTLRYLIKRHQEPWRRYHTLEHVADVLDVVDDNADLCDDAVPVALAVWFHDAVYRPQTRDDDEAASALLAEDRLGELGVDPATVGEVVRLVLLTRDHRPGPDDPNGAVICDADLAVLGSGRWRYARYADGVRFEYRHLSDDDFRPRREAALWEFLRRDRIFHTDRLYEQLDSRARLNLRWEISRLEDPDPVIHSTRPNAPL